MVCLHIGKPFALHHISKIIHRRLIPDGCLKVFAESPRAGEVLKSVRLNYDTMDETAQGRSVFGKMVCQHIDEPFALHLTDGALHGSVIPDDAPGQIAVSEHRMRLTNPHLSQQSVHFLYHLGISSATTDLPATFGDVKFVCVGGTANRMEEMARHLAKELALPDDVTSALKSCDHKTERYSLFKVGPVLAASHGMGVPSVSILLHELFKLLHLAGCSDVTFLRIGTCGGVGVEEGTVVISEGVFNADLRPVYTCYSLGKPVERPIVVDQELVRDLQAYAKDLDQFPTILGKTFSADTFYEGQARLDGALCSATAEEKDQFLKHLWGIGVRNIEMESAGLMALCHAVGIRAAVVCVCLVNRLESDCPKNDPGLLTEFQKRPILLVARFIKAYLHTNNVPI